MKGLRDPVGRIYEKKNWREFIDVQMSTACVSSIHYNKIHNKCMKMMREKYKSR